MTKRTFPFYLILESDFIHSFISLMLTRYQRSSFCQRNKAPQFSFFFFLPAKRSWPGCSGSIQCFWNITKSTGHVSPAQVSDLGFKCFFVWLGFLDSCSCFFSFLSLSHLKISQGTNHKRPLSAPVHFWETLHSVLFSNHKNERMHTQLHTSHAAWKGHLLISRRNMGPGRTCSVRGLNINKWGFLCLQAS